MTILRSHDYKELARIKGEAVYTAETFYALACNFYIHIFWSSF